MGLIVQELLFAPRCLKNYLINFFTFSYTENVQALTNTALVAQTEYPFHRLPILIACFIEICCAICLEWITSIGYVVVQFINPAPPAILGL